jgi:hypothetical protein
MLKSTVIISLYNIVDTDNFIYKFRQTELLLTLSNPKMALVLGQPTHFPKKGFRSVFFKTLGDAVKKVGKGKK